MKKHLLLILFLFSVCLCSYSQVIESSYHASYCTESNCVYGGGYTLKFDQGSEETTITIDLSQIGISVNTSNIVGVYCGAVMVFPTNYLGNTFDLIVTKPLPGRYENGALLPVTIETNLSASTGFYSDSYSIHIELVYSTEP